MNTPQTMMLGWGSLIAAGGVAFYFAKKDIDARRRDQEVKKTRPLEKLECRYGAIQLTLLRLRVREDRKRHSRTRTKRNFFKESILDSPSSSAKQKS